MRGCLSAWVCVRVIPKHAASAEQSSSACVWMQVNIKINTDFLAYLLTSSWHRRSLLLVVACFVEQNRKLKKNYTNKNRRINVNIKDTARALTNQIQHTHMLASTYTWMNTRHFPYFLFWSARLCVNVQRIHTENYHTDTCTRVKKWLITKSHRGKCE